MKYPLLSCILLAFLFHSTKINAQGFPEQLSLSADGRMLLAGKQAPDGFYDSATIRNVYLDFTQSNYWNLLTTNYQSKTDLAATMTVDGVVYDSVGVRFKGQTSYSMANGQKKSFNITLDYAHEDQNIMGYKTLNFNNAYEDPSFLRDVFFRHRIRRHIPAVKCNFIHLYLNGQDWGIYPNVQQHNKTFFKQWFNDNEGISWRADRPDGAGPGGGGPGGGGGWGDGTAALNYLGADTALYQTYYTLKSSGLDNPWDYLVNATNALNNTAANDLETVLPDYIDIDRTLWLLASEIALTDDDSYVFKGKMDYYLYYDPETANLFPVEYDGNSAMVPNLASSWDAFYHVSNVNYPLLNKILNRPVWRQRYLAHLRTIMEEEMDPQECSALLDNYKAQIDALVSSDPKKIYTYAQFGTEVTALKNFFTTRKNKLQSNTEVVQVAPTIADVRLFVNAGNEWEKPGPGQTANVSAQIASGTGIFAVKLYFATNLYDRFEVVEMFDDGAHQDGASGDGQYGAALPAQSVGGWVRFYIEAAANNTAHSVRYLPTGAEHDVFVYHVDASSTTSPVVINELMAQNTSTVADPQGQYEDWIELYNKLDQPIDLSGYFLSDNPDNLEKFAIPAGTTIAANGYLIFWADEDGGDGPDHCNFKLTATGETLFLLTPAVELIDSVSFGPQQPEQALARVPNGTGPFVAQQATFNANNELVDTDSPFAGGSGFHLAPNPAGTTVYVRFEKTPVDGALRVSDLHGRVMLEKAADKAILPLDVALWPAGIYLVQYGSQVKKLVVKG